MKNAPMLYELVKITNTALDQANEIEHDMENTRLLARAYREIPALPPARNTAGVIDYLNDTIGSGGTVRLLR